VILFGTNCTGNFDDLDKRFEKWPVPTIVELRGTWVGELACHPVVSGGMRQSAVPKLGECADALLYVGARDTLTLVMCPRKELIGTDYGKELNRRSMIVRGKAPDFLLDRPEGDNPERPMFRRPPGSAGASPSRMATSPQ
jgi:hypothetical protein